MQYIVTKCVITECKLFFCLLYTESLLEAVFIIKMFLTQLKNRVY